MAPVIGEPAVGVLVSSRIRVMPLIVRRVADMAEAVRHHAVDPRPGERHDGEERAAHDGDAHMLYCVRNLNEAHLGHLVLEGNYGERALCRQEIYPGVGAVEDLVKLLRG